jgi:glycosyltransferase involved in cell wall biosynthesis
MAKQQDESRRRRLLVVNPTSLLGGAELVLQRLLDAVPDDQWQVTAAIPEGPLAERVRNRDLTVIPIPDLKLPSGSRFLAAPRALGRAVRAARRIRRAETGSDAVVANGLLALPAVRIARPKAPVVLLVHDVLDRFAFRVVLRLCARVVDVAVVPSEAAARSLREQGLPTRVVPNGTPWPVPPAPPEPPTPPVVGELAALTPLKAQDVVLDAVTRLKRRDVIVEFAGEALPKDGSYVEHLRALAQSSGLEGRIRFLGRVEDPLARLRCWSIAVLPSIGQESFGLAVLEAMSVGVPVVATNHGGPPEILGDAGLLVAPGDAEGLAVAIGRLLDDADLRNRCRAAGPRLVANAYTLERQQKVLLSVLRDVTSGGTSVSAGATVR